MLNYRSCIIGICLVGAVIVSILFASSASAQETHVLRITGTGFTPTTLKNGSRAVGKITADGDTIVILERTWDIQGGACRKLLILSNAAHNVSTSPSSTCPQRGRGDELDRVIDDGASGKFVVQGPVVIYGSCGDNCDSRPDELSSNLSSLYAGLWDLDERVEQRRSEEAYQRRRAEEAAQKRRAEEAAQQEWTARRNQAYQAAQKRRAEETAQKQSGKGTAQKRPASDVKVMPTYMVSWFKFDFTTLPGEAERWLNTRMSGYGLVAVTKDEVSGRYNSIFKSLPKGKSWQYTVSMVPEHRLENLLSVSRKSNLELIAATSQQHGVKGLVYFCFFRIR